MAYLGEIMRDVHEVAKKANQTVILPKGNECQLDIDSKEQYDRFEDVLKWAEDLLEIKKVTKLPSKTKGHYHITVEFYKELSLWERIALQAVLGSDLTRELLNSIRAINGDENPSALFKALD